MAPGEGDQNDAAVLSPTSPSLSPTRHRNSLHAPPQQRILPIEIVEEIIIRFPVKFRSQLRCVCKSWNALIFDPKFARRHLRRFNRCILLVRFVRSWDAYSQVRHFMSYPLPSVLKPVTTGGTQIDSPNHWIIGSCDGIICCSRFTFEFGYSFVLWNPSIRKSWEVTPLKILDCNAHAYNNFYGFGYDNLSDSFKLVVILYYECLAEAHVMVHTFGSNSWRKIQDFPGILYVGGSGGPTVGKFVSGALNWLTRDGDSNPTRCRCIIALDLGKESYQTILQPHFGIEVRELTMDVMRDCLCLLANSDVWVMKEYGNSDSWTKLFSFPTDFWNERCPYTLGKNSLCAIEDESLFYDSWNVEIYNYKSGSFRSTDLEYKPGLIFKDTYLNDIYLQFEDMYVEIESLISPFPQN